MWTTYSFNPARPSKTRALLTSFLVLSRPYLLFANRKDIRLVEVKDNSKRIASTVIVKVSFLIYSLLAGGNDFGQTFSRAEA